MLHRFVPDTVRYPAYSATCSLTESLSVVHPDSFLVYHAGVLHVSVDSSGAVHSRGGGSVCLHNVAAAVQLKLQQPMHDKHVPVLWVHVASGTAGIAEQQYQLHYCDLSKIPPLSVPLVRRLHDLL